MTRRTFKRIPLWLNPLEDRINPTTIFTEGFEGAFPSSNWTINTSQGRKFEDVNYKAYAGGWSVFGSYLSALNDHTYVNNMSSYMERTVNLAGYGSATLTFAQWLNTESGYDFLRVKVNGSKVYEASGSSPTWSTKSVNLNSFAGQNNVAVRFEFFSDVSNVPSGDAGVWVDEIALNATPTGALPTPILTTPINNTLNVSPNPTFTWQPVSGADRYRITFSTNDGALPPGGSSGDPVGVFNDLVIGATSYTYTGTSLTAGAKYYWTVRAGNQSTGAGGYWANHFNFTTTAPALPAPTLSAPPNNSTNQSANPTFSWVSVPGADRYRITFSTNDGALPPGGSSSDPVGVFNDLVIGAASYTYTGTSLTAGAKYYWTVRAGNQSTGAGGYWANHFNFTTTAPALPAPTLSAPPNNSTNQSANPTFSWVSVPGADRYRITFSTNDGALPPGGSSSDPVGVFNDLVIGATSYTYTGTSLTAGAKYYWTVRAGNQSAGAGGYWANHFNFTTTAPVTSSGFDYPVGLPDAASWYNAQDFGVNNHLGEDWNLAPAPNGDLGQPVYAAADGVVTYAQNAGTGWNGVVIIRHTNGGSGFVVPGGSPVAQVESLYGHLDLTQINNWVTVNSTVTRGQQIGVIGPTPQGSSGPHLHLEIRTTLGIGPGPGYSSNSAGWTDPSNFIDANRPSGTNAFPVPTLQAPVTGATNVIMLPTFSWTSVGSADYRIIVASNPSDLPTHPGAMTGGESMVLNKLSGGNTSYTVTGPTPFQPNTTYHWTVHGGSPGAGGHWAVPRSFTTAFAVFPAPSLTDPANGTTTALTPTFTWTSSQGAAGYRIVVTTNQGDLPTDPQATTGGGTTVFAAQVAGTTYTTQSGSLTANTQYFWTVRGEAPGTGGTWAASGNFSTQPPVIPSAPILDNPGNGSSSISLTPNFSWQPIGGVAGYRIMIATNPSDLPTDPLATAGGASVVISEPAGGTTFTPANPLSAATNYYWSVRGDAPGLGGNWSAAYSFTTTNPVPTPPTLLQPGNNASGQSITPIFTWESLNGVAGYRIMIATNPSDLPTDPTATTGGASVVMNEPCGSATFTSPMPLSGGTNYYWSVRGDAPVVGGQWASAYLFATSVTVTPPAVAGILIEAGAPQRSRVTDLVVIFDQPVTLPANPAVAFQLKRQSDNAIVSLNSNVNGNTVTLSFTGGPVESSSLADGKYTLTALAAQINGGNFDGNGDGTPGDNYQLIGTPANGLFRLFGDSNGDGTVNGADFLAFRLAFLGAGSTFDFDGSGQVNANDFLQFRLRFLLSI